MEENQNPKNLLSFKTIIIAFLLLIMANLLYLDFVYYKSLRTPTEKNIAKPESSPSSKSPKSQSLEVCPNSCITEIYRSTMSAQQTTDVPSSTPATAQSISEFFVPFGSGESLAPDWEDVTGLKSYIDTTKYPPIQKVVFEASIYVPTGNQKAEARLYNETDKHPVWFSEVSLEGGTPQFLISKPITLNKGEKLYKVQMKTSLKFKAILNQARVRITTK